MWQGGCAYRAHRPDDIQHRGVEQRQLVGLITQRSQVRVLPPQPDMRDARHVSDGRFALYERIGVPISVESVRNCHRILSEFGHDFLREHLDAAEGLVEVEASRAELTEYAVDALGA